MLWDSLVPETLDWQVAMRPIYRYDGKVIPHKQEVYRRDTDTTLCVVGTDYTPIQNHECAQYLQQINGTVEKAGTFDNGMKVWWAIKLPGEIVLARETLYKYSIMVNAHDGTLGFRWFITPIRPRCSNMMNLLVRSAIDFSITSRHTKNIVERVWDASKIFESVQTAYDEMALAFTLLDYKPFDYGTLKQYVASVLRPVDIESTRFSNTFNRISTNYIRDCVCTHWGALNAVTQYLDHQRPLRGEGQESRRFANSIFGTTAKLKQRAYDMLQEDNHGRPAYISYTGPRTSRHHDSESGTGAQEGRLESVGMDDEEG